ncbi:cytochrome ubiquinol oxidase subunit I [Candidatus Fokinia crypta]|uniref:Cytochrome bd ubiquinol oxidase subunit 1 n=1 Tax=Candidatus Fokinia crypta TaxID=1920990 RepID=A0ABZ0UNB7_9RICK|nr:cytochrome ubiquinol oxidase subunit I [Candidatus Fokinia cryptica]WPX97611.1 Cytochrome bd ubiquinol oxidase subunit 1 [Candidatus Fokinia cryptica]
MTAEMLARLQFAANITFHILFPSITIALSWILLYFKCAFNRSQSESWKKLYMFWTKVFGLSFSFGVVSGVTMSFQFGTNWPGFMEKVGNIAGPLLGNEVLSAFFLEATFLGIMLFGFGRVPNLLHDIATFLVAVGTTLSAFWIISLNSWMHTPAGFEIIDGVVIAKDWFQVVFNPSFPYQFSHVLIGSGITAAFLITGIETYKETKNSNNESVVKGKNFGILLITILLPIQIIIGDLHGLNVLKHNPAAIAAMEGLWETKKGIPLVVFAIPNEKKAENKYSVEIPKLSSLILTHSWNGEVRGIDSFETHPPVLPVFFAFRIMVGMGFLMFFIGIYASYRMIIRKSYNKFLNTILIFMTFSGWIANIAGWYVSEVGRQPYLVFNILTRTDALSKIVSDTKLSFTFPIYLIMYVVLLCVYVWTIFYMARNDTQKQ